MKVAMLIPPYRYGLDPAQWISVPPQGYGGIQWVASAIIDGLLKCGVEVLLIGAPGSPERAGLSVSAATEEPEVREALQQWKPDPAVADCRHLSPKRDPRPPAKLRLRVRCPATQERVGLCSRHPPARESGELPIQQPER